MSEIKEEMGIELNTIKSKWNSLRAQFGRELAKEAKTKSGQSLDEVYESSWSFMGKMRFVEQVKKTAKSTSTLQISSEATLEDEEHEEREQNDEIPVNSTFKETPASNKRKRTANVTEQKQKLIAKCIDVLDRPKNVDRNAEDPFALYVSEQLKSLDKRRRLLAEKKINDILFELRFEDFEVPPRFNQSAQSHHRFVHPQPFQPVQSRFEIENQFQQQQTQQTYTAMLNDY